MFNFEKKPSRIILRYQSYNLMQQVSMKWVFVKFRKSEQIEVHRAFFLRKENLKTEFSLMPENDDGMEFVIAKIDGDYYHFNQKILGINNNLYIHKDVSIDNELFLSKQNISIFRAINRITDEDVYIGGSADNAIPEEEFILLLKDLPNSYEIKLYAETKTREAIKDYLVAKKDIEKQYLNYINKKGVKVGVDIKRSFADIETQKYEDMLAKLNHMLGAKVLENKWQEKILHIITFLYPKYINVFKEVYVWDSYNSKYRRIDLMLVDSAGNIDIIEIKSPSNNSIIGKKQYRDNYTPHYELSNTVMQVEKYIFYLNKWGKRGEEELTEKYESQLPTGLKIKITNPNGIIIMGRSHNLTDEQQKQDFEIIKRKYKNVIDIMTYDDLIERLEMTLESWRIYNKQSQ